MDDGSKPPLASLIILLCFSAFLAFAETAFASVSRNKIKIAADRGDNRAKKALFILNDFEKAITTILICTNIAHLSVATIVTVYVTKRWSESFVTLSTIITTIVVFFAAEMLPKTIAKKYSFKISLTCASIIKFLMTILTPASMFLASIGKLASKNIKEEETSVTEDELQDIIEDMAEDGTLDEEQSELISNAVQFGDQTAEKILTPRKDICAVNLNDSPRDILEFIKKQKHSRLPVYKDSIDNIVGVLNVRKYMKGYMQLGTAPKLKPYLDDVYYAPANTLINDLLPLMSKHKINIAVIKDSYDGTLGIVTVEDILEELVGEIWDENDIVSKTETKKTAVGIDLSGELQGGAEC